MKLLTLLLVLNWGTTTFAEEDKDYWKDTKINLSVFEQFALTHCYDSDARFLGCVDAVKLYLANGSPAVALLTDQEAAGNTRIGKQIASFPGGLNVYEVITSTSETQITPTEEKAQRKQRQLAHVSAIKQLYGSHTAEVPFKSIVEQFKSQVLQGKFKDKEAMLAAYMINNYLSDVYDPHTYIFTVAEQDAMMSGTMNDYAGIGTAIALTKDNRITFPYIMEDSPAMKAGLHAKDIVLRINGKSTKGWDVTKARAAITGAAGTKVKLKIERNGKVLKKLKIVRQKIHQDNVKYSMVNDTGTPYGFIKLGDFMDPKSANKIALAILDLESQGAQGFILDLRDNGGGLLNLAIEIASLFLGENTDIVTVRNLENLNEFDSDSNKRWKSGKFTQKTKLPLVTLIDSGSASASEVLSGALQDQQRSWIVGDRSFGKATVQAPFESDPQVDPQGLLLTDDHKIILRKTIQRFYQPSGRTNQIQGIVPDFTVASFPNTKIEDEYANREEDNATNALPPLGTVPPAACPEEIERINRCRAALKKNADVLFQEKSTDPEAINPPDYRVLVAQDILKCAAAH